MKRKVRIQETFCKGWSNYRCKKEELKKCSNLSKQKMMTVTEQESTKNYAGRRT